LPEVAFLEVTIRPPAPPPGKICPPELVGTLRRLGWLEKAILTQCILTRRCMKEIEIEIKIKIRIRRGYAKSEMRPGD
jgi:hypothetical protein